MSEKFSTLGWAIRTLRGKESCIADSSGLAGYYALAEDHRGDHYPYPKLPQWGKLLFNLKLGIEITKSSGRFPHPKKRRGKSWWFECDVCGSCSFFTFRGRVCQHCGARYKENGQFAGLDPHHGQHEFEELPF